MKNQKLKISVIVTCHNLEEYIEQTIQSLFDQLRPADEIILVHDDCEKPKAFARVKILMLDKNVGVAKARDMGVKLCSGDYILFLDADDVLPITYLSEMEKIIIAERADVIYPNSYLWSSWNFSGLKNEFHGAPNSIKLRDMLEANAVICPSLIRKEVYDKYGPMDSSLPLFEDWDFFLKLLVNKCSFVKADTYLMYRQRTTSRNHIYKGKERSQIFYQIRSRYE